MHLNTRYQVSTLWKYSVCYYPNYGKELIEENGTHSISSTERVILLVVEIPVHIFIDDCKAPYSKAIINENELTVLMFTWQL